MQKLSDFNYQKLSFHFFFDWKCKNVAVWDIFIMNKQNDCSWNDSVSLHLNWIMLIIEFLFLFIDRDLLTAVPHHINLLIEHRSQLILFTLLYHYSMLSLLLLYRQILFIFCNTITIFADDYNEINPILRMISDWVIMGNSSSLSTLVWLCILIVVSNISDTTSTYNVLKIKTLYHSLHQLDPQSCINAFSSILLLSLSLTKFSSGAQHQHIRNVLDEEMNKIRALRAQYYALFLMMHLSLFFHYALVSIAWDSALIFDFVKMSCCWNLMRQDYNQHLSEFLIFELLNFISHPNFATYLALLMLMNAYPLKIHWFNSLLVFCTMYRLNCFAVLKWVNHLTHLKKQQCWQIKCKFIVFFNDLKATDESSFNAHTENIKMQISF